MAKKLNYGINFDLIKKVDSDTESTVKSDHLTLRSHDCNAGENLTVLDRIDSIKVKAEQLLAVYDPNKVNVISDNLFKEDYKKIETIEELQKALSDVLIRFDTNPDNYKKDDYFALLRVLKGASLFLYEHEEYSKTKFQEIDNAILEINQTINNILNLIDQLISEKFSVSVVDALPLNPSTNIIYILREQLGGLNIYLLYLYYNNTWVPISSSQSTGKIYPFKEYDLVSIDAEGNLVDSGYNFVDIAGSVFIPLDEIVADRAIASYNNVNIDNKFSTLDQTNNTLNEKIAALEDDVSDLQDSIQDLSDDITELVGEIISSISALDDTLEDHTTSLSNISNSIDGIEDDIETLNGEVADISDAILDVQGDIEDMDSDISTLSGRVTDVETSLETAQGNIGDLEDAVEDILEALAVTRVALQPRINPIFYDIHRPAGDRGSNCISNCYLETTSEGKFYNFDIYYYTYVATSAIQAGFPLGSIIFLFPRPEMPLPANFADFITNEMTPYKTKSEILEDACINLGKMVIVGGSSLATALNTNMRECVSTSVGEIIVNSTFFINSSNENITHITGRYKVADSWTMEEYNNYVFE